MTNTPTPQITPDQRYSILTTLDVHTIDARLARLHVLDTAGINTIVATAKALRFDMLDSEPGVVAERYLTTDNGQQPRDRWAIMRILEILATTTHAARPVPASVAVKPDPDNPFETALLRLTALRVPSRIATVAALEAGAPSMALTTITRNDLIADNGKWTHLIVTDNDTTRVVAWPQWAQPHLAYEFELATGDDWLLAGKSHATDPRRRESALLMRRRDNEESAGYFTGRVRRTTTTR